MQVIPAIDIRGGKVVRLAQGRFAEETVYPGSPVETAKKWEAAGAAMIHVVDLDGARTGRPVNLDIVRQVASAVKAGIELGGGVRDEDAIRQAVEAGVSKVVLGTAALDESFLQRAVKAFGDRIVAGIDAREGIVYTKGWVVKTRSSAVDLARKAESAGVRTVNYTDISKDGMLGGPNIDSVTALLEATRLDVVLSGGVSSIDDIKRLRGLPGRGLKGVIIGKALYEGRVDLGAAIRAGGGGGPC
jgi:phosphoribosylformimino-5-aminoimidazole carboxamide ribotide isomerase